MDYKDPLFSLIVFFSLILSAIIISFIFSKIRENLREKEIEKFLKEFDYSEVENANSLNVLLLLAKAYEKNGDYDEALKIYLLIEKKYPSYEVLKNIAFLYFKAGFLLKAKEILYKILKVRPRDKEALKLLILVDEKLREFREIVEIIEIFDILGEDLEKEKANALINLLNRCEIEFCKNFKTFEDIYKAYPFVKREYIEYLFKTDSKKAYEILDVYEHLDLYFYREDIPDNEKFCNILAAKKKKRCNKKAKFEVEVLKYLPINLAELEFEYICTNCKKTFPLYSSRCPNCYELFSQRVLFKLVEKKNIENIEI